MQRGLPVARVAGIQIRAHWSVLLISALLTWGLAQGIVPAASPGTPLALIWGASAVAALLLIASLTAHELAHSLLARRRGVAVEGITLWVFGGVSHIRGDWGSARTEMLVAAAGPAVTAGLAAVFTGMAFALNALAAPALLVLIAAWLAGVNVLLLVFNLVPAFPLDGGRILRGLLWARSGDRVRATITAARAGRVFAFALAALGLADFLLTADFTGLWLVFIGWFLDTAAKSEQRAETVRRALAGVRVGEVMTANPPSVPSWLTVDLLIDQLSLRPGVVALPAHGVDGSVVGLVTITRLKRVPPPQRRSRRVADVMLPVVEVPAARVGDLVTDLLARVGAPSDGTALVFDGDRVVGIVSPADIGRHLQLTTAPPRASTPAPWLPPAR